MNKQEIKNKIVKSLKGEEEIEKIFIFGSFNTSESPNDIDIAIVQNSSMDYLSLAMKYRKLIRDVSLELAVDVFPIKSINKNYFFTDTVKKGELIYAR